MTGVNFIQNALYLAVYLIFVCLIGVLFYGVKKYKQEKRLGSIFVTALVSIFLFFFLIRLLSCVYTANLCLVSETTIIQRELTVLCGLQGLQFFQNKKRFVRRAWQKLYDSSRR